MENLKLILDQFERLKGQFVITESWKIERLVAVGEDDHDYYWVTYDGRKLNWSTCVGRVIELKGKLNDSDYESFVRTARLNHFDQSSLWGNRQPEVFENFCKEHRSSLEELSEGDRLLTPIHWDLN